MNIFITGTDTGVGKTVVTAGLAAVMQGLGYKTGVYKPVQSGAIHRFGRNISPDLEFVKSIDPHIITKCSYNLIPPTAPSLAAYLDNVVIEKTNFVSDYLEINRKCDIVIVEGAGGLLVPIFQDFMVRDLIKLLEIPLLIVARPDLGTINHTLMTIECAKNKGLNIIGVIISNYPKNSDDPAIKTAAAMIEELSDIKVLGKLPEISDIDDSNDAAEPLVDAVLSHIDIQEVFKIKIPKLSKCL